MVVLDASACLHANSMKARDRFPTLLEVLSRQSASPVALHDFYVFLQRDGNEAALDFWLDVRCHESLCQAYVYSNDDSNSSMKAGQDEADNVQSLTLEEFGVAYTMEPNLSSRRSSAAVVEPVSHFSTGSVSTPVSRFRFGPEFSLRSRRGSLQLGPGLQTVSSRGISLDDLVASAKQIHERYLRPGHPEQIILPPAVQSAVPSFSESPGLASDAHRLLVMFSVPKGYVCVCDAR